VTIKIIAKPKHSIKRWISTGLLSSLLISSSVVVAGNKESAMIHTLNEISQQAYNGNSASTRFSKTVGDQKCYANGKQVQANQYALRYLVRCWRPASESASQARLFEVIGYRGTANNTELASEFYSALSSVGSGGQRYSTIWGDSSDAFNTLPFFADRFDTTKSFVSTYANKSHLIFTGHSLGGALSHMAGYNRKQSGIPSGRSAFTMSFNSPRIFTTTADRNRHRSARDDSDFRVYLVERTSDFVSAVPPQYVRFLFDTSEHLYRASMNSWWNLSSNHDLEYDNSELNSFGNRSELNGIFSLGN